MNFDHFAIILYSRGETDMKKIFIALMLLLSVAAFADTITISKKTYNDMLDNTYKIILFSDGKPEAERDEIYKENNYKYGITVIEQGSAIVRTYVTDEISKAARFYEKTYLFTLYDEKKRGKLLSESYEEDFVPPIFYFVYEIE